MFKDVIINDCIITLELVFVLVMRNMIWENNSNVTSKHEFVKPVEINLKHWKQPSRTS